jgi:hypothetical protein
MWQREPVQMVLAGLALGQFLLPWLPELLGPWGLYQLTPEQQGSLDLLFNKVLPGGLTLLGVNVLRQSVWSPASVARLREKLTSLVAEDKKAFLHLLD